MAAAAVDTRQSLVAGADCGSERYLYLSYATARALKHRTSPRVMRLEPELDSDGMPRLSYVRYPVCGARTGAHTCVCQSARGERSDFVRYGSGVVLYFKFVKLFTVLFCLLSLLSLPALWLFGSAGEYVRLQGGVGSSGVQPLAWTTLGNLGEAANVCADGYEVLSGAGGSPVLTVACSGAGRIGAIEAAYGAPTGSCACPVAQRVSPTTGR